MQESSRRNIKFWLVKEGLQISFIYSFSIRGLRGGGGMFFFTPTFDCSYILTSRSKHPSLILSEGTAQGGTRAGAQFSLVIVAASKNRLD